jgi:ubiquinone/menaquinone biosynthesis C-methylase UbiE
MTRPFYTSFSWAYDLLIDEPVAGRLQFIVEMLAQSGIRPDAHVLDAGCGTGRYSVALAKAGFRVTGIDASHDQVAEAKKRRDRSGKTDINFIVGDICKLQHDPTFDAILCRGVLNDLTDDASRQAVFPSFAAMLRSGGILILDVREWTATEIRKAAHPVFEKEVDTERGRLSFRSVTELHHETRTLEVHESHKLDSPNGPRDAEFTFTMRCWTKHELEASLTAAGFGPSVLYGDYDISKSFGSSDRIVAVTSMIKPKNNEGQNNRVKDIVANAPNPHP